MSSETFSVILWCWHDLRTDVIQLRTVRSDTAEEVHLRDGAFLLRIWREEREHEHEAVYRCQIRHLASGREAYLQGGSNLRAFVRACLVSNADGGQATSETSGK